MSSDRLGALFDSLEGELRLCMALVGGAYPDPAATLREHEAILAALDADATRNMRARCWRRTWTRPSAAISGVLAAREAAADRG